MQGGVADPERLAITGGSYGGVPAIMAALLADQIVCGADSVPAELGDDPCEGAPDGGLVPWTTPDGSTTLNWVASVPMYTFGHLLQVLAPNGRWSDGAERAPESGDPTEPFGVPLEGTVSGLLATAQIFGSVAPVDVDPDSDLITSTARLAQGDPFPPDEPAVRDGAENYSVWKSAVSIEPQGRVPIFWVQGMSDALFPATEALTVRDHVLAADGDYPFKLFLGDLGHDYAAERQDDWDLVKEQMHAFVEHYLSPDTDDAYPDFDVGVSVVRCLDEGAPQQYVSWPDWLSHHGALRGGPDRRDLRVHARRRVHDGGQPGRRGRPGHDRRRHPPGGAHVARRVVRRGAGPGDPGRVPARGRAGRCGTVALPATAMAYRFPAGDRIKVEVTANDAAVAWWWLAAIPLVVAIGAVGLALNRRRAQRSDESLE